MTKKINQRTGFPPSPIVACGLLPAAVFAGFGAAENSPTTAGGPLCNGCVPWGNGNATIRVGEAGNAQHEPPMTRTLTGSASLWTEDVLRAVAIENDSFEEVRQQERTVER